MHSISNHTFLQTIFDGLPDDETAAVCTFSCDPGEQRYWSIYPPDKIDIQPFMTGTKPANAFFCISSVVRAPRLRRTFDNLRATYVLPLDDIGTGKGAKMTADKVPLAPTYAIETSPGNFQYGYVMAEPIEDLAQAKALIRMMTSTVGDGGAPIPNKLIRLPVGINNKAKYGTPPPKTKMPIWEPDRMFTVEDILDAWGVTEEALLDESQQYQRVLNTAVTAPVGDDDVLGWLEKTDQLLTTEADDKGFYEIVCPWHESHSEGGSDSAGYSPLKEGGAEYGGSRQFHCLHDHCKDRTAADIVSRAFMERFTYATEGNLVYDALRPHKGLTKAHFELMTLPYVYYQKSLMGTDKARAKKIQHSDRWLSDPNRQEVVRETFFPAPERGTVFTHPRTGERLFNTFVPYAEHHPHTEDESKLAPILYHLEYLFGAELSNLLAFLAYTIHEPEKRLTFALLHVSTNQGTGRGWMKRLIDRLFVYDYHHPASFDSYANGGFTEFMHRALLVTFDEVYDRQRKYTIGERLRELITETSMEINVKFGFKGTAEVHANMMFFSNHMDALDIPDADRRFWCVVCDKDPLSPDQLKESYDLLEDQTAITQMFWYLKRFMEKGEFSMSPVGRAPETKWREELMNANIDDSFDGPIREVLATYRAKGVNAIFRRQLINDCKAAGLQMVLGRPGDKDERRLAAIFKQLHVRRRTQRMRDGNNVQQTVMFLGIPIEGATQVRVSLDLAEALAAPAANLYPIK